MAWTSGESGGSGDNSSSAALMDPLLASRRSSDALNSTISFDFEADDNATLTPQASRVALQPPPISGNVPSPTSGIHTLRDGVNHTILPTAISDQHHQLRHRVHYHERSHSRSTPGNIYGTQSLDDADAAAGAVRGVELTVLASRGRSPQSEIGVRSEPIKNRSYSHPVNIAASNEGNRRSPIRPSRSLGNTPEKPYFITHSISEGAVSTTQNNGSPNNFFNSSAMGQYFNEPPNAQRMDRGLRSAYGGSEHDFLLLSSVQDDDGSSASSAMSQGETNAMSRRRGHPYSSPKRGGGIPSLPPIEITTDRASSYPPYGLPSIEGSPSVAKQEDRKKMLQLSSSVDATNVLEPPLLETSAKKKSRFVVLGWDLSSYDRRSQFLISAGGTFGFSLLYGYLQELISVELCHRKLGLFLALAQFTGYTILSYFFRKLEMGVNLKAAVGSSGSSLSSSVASGGGSSTTTTPSSMSLSRRLRRLRNWGRFRGKQVSLEQQQQQNTNSNNISLTVPLELYVGLSILRAIDLGMTNLAMQYVNYPAKTLMKSTRVVFTMIFGVIVSKKRYGAADFSIVGLMVVGLGMFMHADAKTSAVFQPLGIIMLTISLLCDGAISNLSEALMNQYNVGQDEFIFRLYSIATIFICIAAALKGDLHDGLVYLSTPGTLKEMEEGLEPTWSILGKMSVMALFFTTGFLGSSTSAAITKSFGALTMSITSTARKATTIFLSFALFPNECTVEHIGGIFLFITSLVAKSLRASKRGRHHHGHHHHKHSQKGGGAIDDASNNNSTSRCSPLHLRRKACGEDAV